MRRCVPISPGLINVQKVLFRSLFWGGSTCRMKVCILKINGPAKFKMELASDKLSVHIIP